jgi:hypothetical protein
MRSRAIVWWSVTLAVALPPAYGVYQRFEPGPLRSWMARIGVTLFVVGAVLFASAVLRVATREGDDEG